MADTIVAPATPPGISALAMVRLSGPRAVEMVAELSGLSRKEFEDRHARLVELRDQEGELIDQAMVTVYLGPRSYTGEDLVEITLHGNPLLVELVVEECIARGARLAEPGEFTRRALLRGKLSPDQVEALGQVITARTRHGLRLARRNLAGKLGEKLSQIRQELVETLAAVEVVFDYPGEAADVSYQEGETLADEPELLGERIERLIGLIQPLVEDYPRLSALSREPRVVIWGAPNAGKSSLFNALLGRERALVSPAPGTTRDYLEAPLELAGLRLSVVDTAGIREQAGEEVEEKGIRLAEKQLGEADLILAILERGDPASLPPLPMEEGQAVIYVATKVDLMEKVPQGEGSSPEAPLGTSSLTGLGIEELRQRIARHFTSEVGEDRLLVSRRQYESLRRALAALEQAREGLRRGVEPDLVALDLRAALEEVSGLLELPGASEAVIAEMLRGFCVGK